MQNSYVGILCLRAWPSNYIFNVFFRLCNLTVHAFDICDVLYVLGTSVLQDNYLVSLPINLSTDIYQLTSVHRTCLMLGTLQTFFQF